jgi:hypothetical protein
MATYPNSIFFWQPRIDQQNIVFANDPNTLANEIIAVEQAVGVNPQIEKHPPTGTGFTYRSLDSRVSAAMGNWEMPFGYFYNPGFFIGQGQQLYNTYRVGFDPYGYFNGQDLTIRKAGFYSIHANQKWNQQGDNFIGGNVLIMLWNGKLVDAEMWQWDNFFGNSAYKFASNAYSGNGFSRVRWQGALAAGDHIQFLSVNSTFCPGINVSNVEMSYVCYRIFPVGTQGNSTPQQLAGTTT